MRTLIIGCGYLGRRVAALWRARGEAVSALTRSTDHARTLVSLGIEPIVGDVLQPFTLRSLPSADVVLYAVGYDKHVGVSKREIYVRGLENVLRQISPRIGRLLYISSTSVYGQDAGEWVDETSPCVPTTDDGRICLAAEEIVRSCFPRDDSAISATVLRFSGIYGPGRLLRRIDSLRNGEPIEADPQGFLNLIHVDDGARIVSALAERRRLQATYLVTDDRPVQRRDYYMRLAELAGSGPPLFQAEQAAISSLNKRCSNARLRAELGNIFQFPTFDTGLPNAITSESATPPP